MHKIFEDPTYDEDGIMIDEELDAAEWEEAFPEPTEQEIEEMLRDMEKDYDPYNTVNS